MIPTTLSSELLDCLQAGRFDRALELYYEILLLDRSFFSSGSYSSKQHAANAANLARKNLYDKLEGVLGISQRFDQAVKQFFGLEKKRFDLEVQQPNFFFIPGLPSKPFFDIVEIPGLANFYGKLSQRRGQLEALCRCEKESYVDVLGNVPEQEAWQKLRKKRWGSVHFIKGGQPTDAVTTEMSGLLSDFKHPAVADCPPHAPEAFVSELQPGVHIPPHFGISNVKLTAHFPIFVNDGSYVTVGDQTRYWRDHKQGLVFDDSYRHSAGNDGDTSRFVFIFDVWNPHLTDSEKQCIKTFMAEHGKWADTYGKMAGLDA